MIQDYNVDDQSLKRPHSIDYYSDAMDMPSYDNEESIDMKRKVNRRRRPNWKRIDSFVRQPGEELGPFRKKILEDDLRYKERAAKRKEVINMLVKKDLSLNDNPF